MKRIKKLARLVVVILGLSFLMGARSALAVNLPEGKEIKRKITTMSKEMELTRGPEGELIRVGRAKEESLKYAPGEVLLGLKEGADIKKVLQEVAIEPEKLSRVHDIKPSVEKFRKTYKLEKNSNGWYWFLGKNYKKIEEIPDESLFQEAYKGMTSVEKKLYRSYKISLAKGASVEEIVNKLKSNPNVEYAEPNYILTTQVIPNDPYYSSSGSWGQDYSDLWGLHKICAEQAWDISQGDGVLVAVIDTGIDYNHEDIASNIWTNPGEIPNNGIDDDKNGYIDDVRGWDFIGADVRNPKPDNDPKDGCGHGTHCAGTIAAVGNNAKGIIGVAPKAKVMAVKGLDDSGWGSVTALANCLIYAADMGADVLSNSWGALGKSQTIEDVVNYAHAKGCVVVAAAGNNNTDTYSFTPASIPNIIAVASSDHNDAKSDFSNWGVKIDVAAPGGDSPKDDGSDGPDTYKLGRNILSLRASDTDMYATSDTYYGIPAGICIVPKGDTNGKYYRSRGTSMACPHVAGLAALILSRHPDFSPEQVRQVIRVSADDILSPGKDIYSGYGRINAYKALKIESPAEAIISSPRNYISLSNKTTIKIEGTAWCPEGSLQEYKLEYGEGKTLDTWHLIQTGINSVREATLGTWDISQLLYCQEYCLRLSVIHSDGTVYKDYVSVIFIKIEAGWPQEISGDVNWSNVTLVDINEDGKKEILYATWETVFVFDSSGKKILSISNTKPGYNFIYGEDTISAGELDPNYPGKEIVFSVTDDPSVGKNTYIYVYHADGSIVAGWPQTVTHKSPMLSELGDGLELSCALTIADLNNDGENEIIRSGRGTLCVWDRHGNFFQNWSKKEINGLGANASVGNIDNDPELEIVVRSVENQTSKIYAFDYMGNLEPGWPRELSNGQISGLSISLADFDNDRKDEIVVIETINHLQDSKDPHEVRNVHILNGDGTLRPGWPYSFIERSFFIEMTTPGIGDINQDGFPEIIVNTESEINALDKNANLLWSSLVPIPYSPAIIGDVNNDGKLEILVSTWEGNFYLFDNQGNLKFDFASRDGFSIHSPAIGNIDEDSAIELVLPTGFFSHTMYVIEWPSSQNIPEDMPWPMFRGNPQHTGCYKLPNTPPILASIGNKTVDENQLLRFTVSATDPDGDKLTYSVSNLPSGATFSMLGDLNNDGKIDQADVDIFIIAFMSRRGDANWNEMADLNNDGIINISDFGIMAVQNPNGPFLFIWTPTYNQAGTYNVIFKVEDGKGGQASETITITVNDVDITPPTGSIKINNNATYTRSTSVTLNLSATDTGSGLSQMQFSNDNVTWSTPQTFVTTKAWTLTTANGTKTVYAKFKDNAGNWSSVVLDTIILDTIAPTITNISDSPDPFDPEAGQSTKISYTLADNLSSSLYGYVYIYNSAGAFVRSIGSAKPLGNNYASWDGKNYSGYVVADGTYKYRILAQDIAGNYVYSGYYYVTKK